MADRKQLLNCPEEAFRIASEGQQSSLWTALPAIATAVDFTKMTISAQPTIKGEITDENGATNFVNLPLLVDVPLCFPRAGGFSITFPVAVNDEVLIVFASRCIDAWWQSGGVQKAMEARMHDLSDGFAILAPSSQPKVLSAISSTAMQIRNDAGTSFIEISADGKIKLTASEVDIIGNLKVSGTIQGNTATVPIGLSTHVHGGVSTGGGSTSTGVG